MNVYPLACRSARFPEQAESRLFKGSSIHLFCLMRHLLVFTLVLLAALIVQVPCSGTIPTADSESSPGSLLKTHRELGLFSAQEQDIDRLIKQAETVPMVSPSNASACVQLGYAFLSKAIELREGTSSVLPSQITNYFRQADLQFQRASDLDKSSAAGLLGQTAVCQELGEDDKALLLTREAVAREPGKWNTWFCQGLAFERIWRTQEATESYRKSISLGPTLPLPYVNLARLNISLHRYEDAVAISSNATVRFPSDSTVLGIMSFSLTIAGTASSCG